MTPFAPNPIQLSGAGKSELRTQFAALPYRVRKDKIEVCLITSRRRNRWIIPKGWPMDGKTPSQAAATEAFEEAGLTGKIHDQCIGVFTYTKILDTDDIPCVAMVFALKVKNVASNWPEKHQRKRKWVSLKKAAKLADEPELAAILRRFDPKLLKR